MIQALEQGQIDRKKWDKCISVSRADLIYGYSWYLDLVCPGWMGIAEDDYSFVMPLPVKKKFGILYSLQPSLTQQLGVFSRNEITGEILKSFLDHIPTGIKYLEMNINYSNSPVGAGLKVISLENYELKLNRSHRDMENRYSDNVKRNIKRSVPFIEIFEDPLTPDFIRLKKENTIVKRSAEFYEWMNIFIDKLKQLKKGKIIGAKLEGRLVAAVFITFSGNRIYYLLPVSNPEGKEQRAMFGLIDYIIGKYSNSGMILDFEGSNIPGVARLFAGFGAKAVNYHSVRINRLPVFLRLLKNI